MPLQTDVPGGKCLLQHCTKSSGSPSLTFVITSVWAQTRSTLLLWSRLVLSLASETLGKQKSAGILMAIPFSLYFRHTKDDEILLGCLDKLAVLFFAFISDNDPNHCVELSVLRGALKNLTSANAMLPPGMQRVLEYYTQVKVLCP